MEPRTVVSLSVTTRDDRSEMELIVPQDGDPQELLLALSMARTGLLDCMAALAPSLGLTAEQVRDAELNDQIAEQFTEEPEDLIGDTDG